MRSCISNDPRQACHCEEFRKSKQVASSTGGLQQDKRRMFHLQIVIRNTSIRRRLKCVRVCDSCHNSVAGVCIQVTVLVTALASDALATPPLERPTHLCRHVDCPTMPSERVVAALGQSCCRCHACGRLDPPAPPRPLTAGLWAPDHHRLLSRT